MFQRFTRNCTNQKTRNRIVQKSVGGNEFKRTGRRCTMRIMHQHRVWSTQPYVSEFLNFKNYKKQIVLFKYCVLRFLWKGQCSMFSSSTALADALGDGIATVPSFAPLNPEVTKLEQEEDASQFAYNSG